MVEVIAPAVGGVTLTDGHLLPADQKLGGGPSVLYDAVAVVVDESGAAMLAEHPAAKDFVTDAHAHCKYVGHTASSLPLFEATGLSALMDDGYLLLDKGPSCKAFIERCRSVRYWGRAHDLKSTWLVASES
jgi:catalase